MMEKSINLRDRATIREFQFSSSIPIIGPVLGYLRSFINGVAGKWSLRFASQQQSVFNHLVVDQLDALQSFLAASLRDMSQAEEKRNAELRTVFERLANLERQAAGTDRSVLRLNRDLAELATGIQLSAQLIAERVEHIESTQAVLLDKQDLVALRQALTEQGQALAEQHQALAEQGQALAEQHQALAEQGQALAEQHQALAEQGQALAEQHQALAEKGQALAEQHQALAEQGQALAEQHQALAEQRIQTGTLQDEIVALRVLWRGEQMTELDRSSPTAVVPRAERPVATDTFDYFFFELRYRGTVEEITRRQEDYLRYFQNGGVVLDIGCGRGEFIKLLLAKGVEARGVDLDPDMVDYCRQLQLPVEQADGIDVLAAAADNSLGGIFLGQLVEHLPPTVLAQLIHLAYRKLRPDAYLVAETINPMCLLALTSHYLMDMSHVRPVHPEALRFLLISAGFRPPTVQFSEPVPDQLRLKRLPWADSLSTAEKLWIPILNENVDRLNDFLYGNQDYAVFAQKMVWPQRLASTEARRDVILQR
jgi:SAM-dependent methyltransferase